MTPVLSQTPCLNVKFGGMSSDLTPNLCKINQVLNWLIGS